MAVTGKILNHVLKKFMTAEVTKEARVQIELPNGELYDLKEVQLLENVIIGDGESHRLVFRCEKPVHRMGKIIRKL
mgnify:CR=1 FL=1|jgi:hypothetical protein|tara:strand:- start:606 stop:833 length:228 start_codon:yes stop_codon:yes gene_type:complete